MKENGMVSKRSFLILILSSAFLSNSYASLCSHLATQINQDVQRGNLNQDPPNWMNLSWLKKHLGPAQKGLIKDLTTYKWVCPESDGSYLSFVVNNGKIIRVSGMYNNDNGNGMFGAALNQTKNPSPSLPAVVVQTNDQASLVSDMNAPKPMMTPVSTQTPATSTANACNMISSQIISDSNQLMQGGPASSVQLPWMQPAWLTQKLGNPIITKVT